jgi:ribosomal protein L29
MPVDERARFHLYQQLTELLGPAGADTLMAHLPLAGWAEVATKGDLDLLRAATKADLDRTAAELHTEMAELRTELHTGMAEVRAEVERSSRRTVVALVAVMATLNAGMLAGAAVLVG